MKALAYVSDEKYVALADVAGDPVLDLVDAQVQRMVEEGGEPRRRQRYAVWGNRPH